MILPGNQGPTRPHVQTASLHTNPNFTDHLVLCLSPRQVSCVSVNHMQHLKNSSLILHTVRLHPSQMNTSCHSRNPYEDIQLNL